MFEFIDRFYFVNLKLATLLYIQNSNDDYLMLERAREPNRGLLSPPGGKCEPAESPFKCASREAFEECGIISKPSDWDLIGIVTEKNYPGIGDIMIFLMKYRHKLSNLPTECNEGTFHFLKQTEIMDANIPVTDKLFIWNFVLNSGSKTFSVFIDCNKTPFECITETI